MKTKVLNWRRKKTRSNAIKPHNNSTACFYFSFLEFCHLILTNDLKRRLKKIFAFFYF